MTQPRTAARWAWATTATTAVSQLWMLWLFAANQDALPDDVASYVNLAAVFVVLAPVFPALGAVILRKFPRHPIGWLLCAAAVVIIADTLARGYAVIGLYLRPGELPGPEYAAWLADWNWFPSIMVLLFYLPLLFPDGHLPSPRWRPVAIAGGWWIGLATIGLALVPEPLVGFPDVPKPIEVPAAMALAVLMLLTPVAIGVALAAVVVRRRRATGVEREQMRWLVYAVAVSVVGWTISMVLGVLGVGWGLVPAVLTLGPLALLPIAITIAIVQYRLYDIDLIINRTLVYGGLTGVVLAGYAVLVLVVTAATGSEVAWRGSVLVVVAVALAAYPLREWLQHSVNRLMYGDRDDPARALAMLSRRVGDALTPETLLPAVAEAVRQALRVPYVAVALAGHDGPTAESGAPRGEPYVIDLVHQGQPVGRLQVGTRPGGEFSAADLRLLDDIAPQVAVAAHAVLLTADLQQSRERLVLAREEERRRLRRDLHDGVGSELAGLALVAGNASTALPDDPTQAQRWVQMLEEGIRATVGDIRRIVDDLRPPALDELGLADALQERADVLVPGTRVFADGVADAALPAAVEVAAYRIAAEALTNTARHADARRVSVQLGIQEQPHALVAEISDDGRGIDGTARPGVGLASMHDRAAELGGSCQVSERPDGGTTVRAVLPIADQHQEAASG